MYDVIVIKSPLQFLINEKEIITSLSFIGPEIVEVEEHLVDTFPILKFSGEFLAETFLVTKPFIEFQSSLIFPLKIVKEIDNCFFIDSNVNFIFDNYTNNYFIRSNRGWITRRFNTWYNGNRTYKKIITYPIYKDFNQFLSWIDDSGFKTEKQIKDNFDYRNFW